MGKDTTHQSSSENVRKRDMNIFSLTRASKLTVKDNAEQFLDTADRAERCMLLFHVSTLMGPAGTGLPRVQRPLPLPPLRVVRHLASSSLHCGRRILEAAKNPTPSILLVNQKPLTDEDGGVYARRFGRHPAALEQPERGYPLLRQLAVHPVSAITKAETKLWRAFRQPSLLVCWAITIHRDVRNARKSRSGAGSGETPVETDRYDAILDDIAGCRAD